MGTEITLDIGAIELTYSKNHPGIDHSRLFQSGDRKTIDDRNSSSGDEALGYRTTLRALVPRLELLGHTITRARAEYDAAIAFGKQERLERAEWDPAPPIFPEVFTFEEIFQHIVTIRPAALSIDIDDDAEHPKRVLADVEVKRLPWYELDSFHGQSFETDTVFSESTSAGYLLGGFDPYTALRLLAEAPENRDCDVTWLFGPLVAGGYADLDEFRHGLPDTSTS